MKTRKRDSERYEICPDCRREKERGKLCNSRPCAERRYLRETLLDIGGRALVYILKGAIKG